MGGLTAVEPGPRNSRRGRPGLSPAVFSWSPPTSDNSSNSLSTRGVRPASRGECHSRVSFAGVHTVSRHTFHQISTDEAGSSAKMAPICGGLQGGCVAHAACPSCSASSWPCRRFRWSSWASGYSSRNAFSRTGDESISSTARRPRDSQQTSRATGSADSRSRALRRAAVLRKMHRLSDAAVIYRQLADIRTVAINGEPIDLVAQRTLCELAAEDKRRAVALSLQVYRPWTRRFPDRLQTPADERRSDAASMNAGRLPPHIAHAPDAVATVVGHQDRSIRQL